MGTGRGLLLLAGGVIAVAIVGIAIVASRGSSEDDAPSTLQSTESADTESEGSSHVPAVVSAHELATQAGMETLERGGSAADAAVAVAATLSVVEPWFSSVLGGGTWALYYNAQTGEVTSLDGVGPTGSNATVEDFAARAEDSGIHQSNVPGAWDGWMLWLEHYGRLDLDEVLEPAIRVARDGYAVGSEMASWLDRSNIAGRPANAAIYAPEGPVLTEGDTVYQLDLAETFEALIAAYDSQSGDRTASIQAARDHYYRGPLAEAIVRISDEQGGYLTLEDFHGFEAQIVTPISLQYNDELTVYQNPPNSQGITMLLALNVLKGFDFSSLDAADALHVQIEAMKLAFADRHTHVGDPARIDVPVEFLLSEEHTEQQRQRIDMAGALSWPFDDHMMTAEPIERDVGDTSTFHIVDRDGNAAAVTTSLGAQFFVIEGTGIHMNNRMRFLALDDGDPNQLTPGFKVRHTSNPYMVLKQGRPYILGGNTGVDTQSQAQVQQFINIVEFGLGAQAAVDNPRWVTGSFPATTYPYDVSNVLELENGFSPELTQSLEDRGHTIEPGSSPFGNAGVIIIHDDGTPETGADERNGTAAGIVGTP